MSIELFDSAGNSEKKIQGFLNTAINPTGFVDLNKWHCWITNISDSPRLDGIILVMQMAYVELPNSSRSEESSNEPLFLKVDTLILAHGGPTIETNLPKEKKKLHWNP